MYCPICKGELRAKHTPEKKHLERQVYCTRCKRYAFEEEFGGKTIWIGGLELYGTMDEIKKNYTYKKILFQEKLKYKIKKIIQKVFRNY